MRDSILNGPLIFACMEKLNANSVKLGFFFSVVSSALVPELTFQK